MKTFLTDFDQMTDSEKVEAARNEINRIEKFPLFGKNEVRWKKELKRLYEIIERLTKNK